MIGGKKGTGEKVQEKGRGSGRGKGGEGQEGGERGRRDGRGE